MSGAAQRSGTKFGNFGITPPQPFPPKPHHITTPASDPRYQQHTKSPIHWRVLHEALATGQRASWTTSTAKRIVTTQVTGETGYVETFSYKLRAPNAPAHRDDLAQPQKDRRMSAINAGAFQRLSRDISTLQILQGADTILPRLITSTPLEVEVERIPTTPPLPVEEVVMRAGRYKKRRVVPQRHQTRPHPLRQSLHRSPTSSNGAQPQGHASVPSKTPHPVGSSPHGGLHEAATAVESPDDLDHHLFGISNFEYHREIETPNIQPGDNTLVNSSLVPGRAPMGFSWASHFGGRVHFLLVCLETRDMLTTPLSVHFLSRQRILLRNRRGLSHRQIQPYRSEHGGSILSICARSSHGCL